MDTIQTLKLGDKIVPFYFIFKTSDNDNKVYDVCLHASEDTEVKQHIVTFYKQVKKSFPDYKVVSGGLLKKDVQIDVNVMIGDACFKFKGKLNIPYGDVPIDMSLFGVRVYSRTEDFMLVNDKNNPYFSLSAQEQNMIMDLYTEVFKL